MLQNPIRPRYPHSRGVEFLCNTTEHGAPNVLRVSEYRSNSRKIPSGMTGPWDAIAIEFSCDSAKSSPVRYIHSIDFPHGLDFMGRAGNQDDAVGCDTFSFA